MGNKQSSRFEMLINVTSKGGGALEKLGKAGEKAGKVFDALEKKMQAAGITTKEGRQQFTELKQDLAGVTSASDKYATKLRLLKKEQDKAKPNPDNLKKYKINNFYSLPGTNFTVGSLVATLCGVPFKLPNFPFDRFWKVKDYIFYS